ncbi:MAG: hypothetical protein PSV18_10410 [Methylobacter sp.]|uniref:Uncharacterized protein n=1 Tax=Candidatus Methylobacter titanis TaxID=3053457 RepID=A0AA43Q4X8_9GAMM|nr:hypothetical protein [Candidatus Methylobacter titanis]MDI1293142.1 hypothetical protein [Candidatus Methylobacter titanis]
MSRIPQVGQRAGQRQIAGIAIGTFVKAVDQVGLGREGRSGQQGIDAPCRVRVAVLRQIAMQLVADDTPQTRFQGRTQGT